jgi:RNA polymerase sigma-70 factor, ECF subfamily
MPWDATGRRYRAERSGPARCLVDVEAMVERGSRGFEDFYQAERATLLRAVAFALGDVDLGAEVTDEAMARAYERWGDVGEMANPSGWVYRVAVNLAYNRTRRRALERRRPVPPDRDRPDVEGVADPEIARALATLPPEQREAIVLRYHLDWSVDAIAEALGCPNGTVKSRLHRALQRLETMLEAPV